MDVQKVMQLGNAAKSANNSEIYRMVISFLVRRWQTQQGSDYEGVGSYIENINLWMTTPDPEGKTDTNFDVVVLAFSDEYFMFPLGWLEPDVMSQVYRYVMNNGAVASNTKLPPYDDNPFDAVKVKDELFISIFGVARPECVTIPNVLSIK